MKNFKRNLVKSTLLSLMITVLSLVTYGANMDLIIQNFIIIFILSLLANQLTDIIHTFYERRRKIYG